VCTSAINLIFGINVLNYKKTIYMCPYIGVIHQEQWNKKKKKKSTHTHTHVELSDAHLFAGSTSSSFCFH